jgi:hypothetical protein
MPASSPAIHLLDGIVREVIETELHLNNIERG